MKMMEDLISKYFSESCNAAERLAIMKYLQEHPQELENYFSEPEWDDFVHQTELEHKTTERMRNSIQASIRTTKVIKMKKWMWAAASVLILGSIGILFFLNQDWNEQPGITHGTQIQLISKVNNSTAIMYIQLPDHSAVQLMPHSRITYAPDYDLTKRDVTLTGEAIFKVAKNKAKPFTVFSNELSTTALGTEFKISAFPNSNDVKVHLLEGKVVIHSTTKPKDGYYLLPGDRLVFNRKTLAANVIKRSYKARASDNSSGGNSSSSSPDNWYMFENQDLAQVFKQIEDIYNVKINYASKDIDRIKFIGKIQRNDSISTVLKDIALMNNLQITRKGDMYTIKKKF
jgi:ferric-dicitrate binding protein FerR (iron transport regulator)